MLGQKGETPPLSKPSETLPSASLPKEMEMNDFASAYPGVVGKRTSSMFVGMDRGGVIQADPRYLDMTPETIRVSDVPGLLEEYKRLAALVAELSRSAPGSQ